MAKLTRRGFFRQTSASVVSIGMLSAGSVIAADPEAPEDVATQLPNVASLSEPVVAHIRDVATSEVSLLVGTREIIYRDPQLVGRLLQAPR